MVGHNTIFSFLFISLAGGTKIFAWDTMWKKPFQVALVVWVEVKVAQLCPTLCDPMDYTIHEFSRPDYWSGQPFPSPGDLPSPGIEPRSPALQVDSLPAEPQGKSSGKEPNCQCRRGKSHGFDPKVQKIPVEEGMATYSSILVWKIPWTEDPGGLQSMGSWRVTTVHGVAKS